MLNHIALLVESVERSAEVFRRLGCKVGIREVWEGEGTAEIYIGDETQSARVLLVEAVKPGAYSRAMRKRGPGLHHIAIDVEDLAVFVDRLSGSGWYLHPASLKTIAKTRTAWLARPGTAFLVEVQERSELANADPFVTRIALPLTSQRQSMMAALGLEAIVVAESDGAHLWFAGHVKTMKEILS